jgi:hypothetical protein
MIVESIDSMGDAAGALAARHMDVAFRRMMAGPRCVEHGTWFRLITGEAHPMGNVALVSASDDVAATLEATAPLIDCGAPAAVIFTAGVTDAVVEAVKAQGFAIEASLPAMAVDIDAMRPTGLPSGYEWARIGGGAEGRAWAEALALGYGLPQALAEERQKGLGAHATAEALRVARQLGFRVGVLQSSEAGHPVYLGLGFGDHASIPMLIRMPG